MIKKYKEKISFDMPKLKRISLADTKVTEDTGVKPADFFLQKVVTGYIILVHVGFQKQKYLVKAHAMDQ
jgi:hypothetical protein